MVYILLVFLFVFATWRWGDWKNWKLYHSTILYFLYGDLLYHYFTMFHYPLWVHRPTYPISKFSVLTLTIELAFGCTTLIYLGHYPEKLKNAVLWLGFWVLLYAGIEGFFLISGLLVYYNGWNYFYSILFDILMFPMLRLHFKNPILAYTLSVPITIILLFIFKVPLR